DYATASGRPIIAPVSGSLECVWRNGYGRSAEITVNGVIARLSHLSRYQSAGGNRTRNGGSCPANVTRGEVVGYVGSSVRSSGPHLHFELRCGELFGDSVNPVEYIDVVTQIPIPEPRPDFESDQEEGYEYEAFGEEDVVL
ncbi:MAG: M23 family metallopeptidase, partial [Bdellovibrionales bacterium]|nr:M23 family metallopeptidase [Bdellovibrionales bacterium]NQZ20368.1 M23 family metallopeptidase [Bdellovibrionales bacterium]